MKNCMKILIAVMLILSCLVSMSSAAIKRNYDAIKKAGENMGYIINDMQWKFAKEITQKQKPSHTSKMADLNEDGTKREAWAELQVFIDGKTIVTAQLAYLSGYLYTNSLMTIDPKKVFSGGIHVGASTKVLEKFFEAPLSEISIYPGLVYSYMEREIGVYAVCIFYKNNKITEIYGQWDSNVFENLHFLYTDNKFEHFGDSVQFSLDTVQFIKKTRKKLGFPNNKTYIVD